MSFIRRRDSDGCTGSGRVYSVLIMKPVLLGVGGFIMFLPGNQVLLVSVLIMKPGTTDSVRVRVRVRV